MDRITAIVDSSDDAILSKNLNGVITSWNGGARRLFGYTAEEAVGKPVAMLIPADRLDEEPEILSRIRRGERIDHYETQRMRKDGSFVDISLTVSPLKDAAGRVIGASKIARDITDQKQTQERLSLLVEEMKHRIKNTLSIVQAIATQTLRDTSLVERDAFISRLHSLSHAHDILTEENWQRASLEDIVALTLEPFRAKNRDRISMNGPEVWLDANKSTLLAMVVHELATNAFKYGALCGHAGHVNISWALPPDNPDVALFKWQESDGAIVVPPSRKGFGSRLIESVLKPHFGEPDLLFLPEGVICRLAIPV
jgi:PAS domain S-box-containing protein